MFEKERRKLVKILPKSSKIEHVGSTSIPGLGGKGIIDIAVSISKKDLKKTMSRLEKLGFEYHPSHPANDKRIFMQKVIKENEKERGIHIHLTLTKSFYDSFISFNLRKNNYVNVADHIRNVK